ncbi:fluoride efflux transporter FluC [Desulfocurvibacter africanus]|uniref:Fluoride-specific ion channel FluC n=1 Tax=Desulfocurvibacter africanus subsp. africanus str. Walvis Bay TaxID=690850 RepID=F3YYQ0_DESAF|nr:CrcB family protein [Desulfocurvibacter africanus]EGJ51876.1 CrcB-like protein [Desulfocurvibacter africanus subsp. africanus str. Walvis Bay]
MSKVLLIGLAGMCGTLARYWLSGAVYAILGRGFPWGTAAVNALGCLLFGFVFVLAEERLLLRGDARIMVLVGFMGAFTTFSTLVFETNQLLRDAQWAFAALNLMGQTVLGFLALWAGMALARII